MNHQTSSIKSLVIITTVLVNIDLDFSKFSVKFNNLNRLECKYIELTNFSNVNSNLTYLYFSRVKLTDIKSYYFRGLIRLQTLSITNNNISRIQNDTFIDLISLLNLQLAHNNIKYIESSAFNGLLNVVSLQLNNNYLVNLNKDTFKYFSTELQKLSIHNNLLTTIDEDIFGNLIKLNELKIFNKRINCNCEIVNWVFKYTLLLHLLNTSANAYVECHQLDTNLFEFKNESNCSNKGKYIYIYNRCK